MNFSAVKLILLHYALKKNNLMEYYLPVVHNPGSIKLEDFHDHISERCLSKMFLVDPTVKRKEGSLNK